jgi:hypothetical protein
MNEPAAPYVLAAGQARSHPGSVPVIKAGAADTGGLLTVVTGCSDRGPRVRRCTSTTRPTSAFTWPKASS